MGAKAFDTKTVYTGNMDEPSGFMLVEYSGGWPGYFNFCQDLITKIAEFAPNAYIYKLVEDDGKTGRFEISVYKNKLDLETNKNGELIHSMKQSKKFPWKTDWDQFKEVAIKHSTKAWDFVLKLEILKKT